MTNFNSNGSACKIDFLARLHRTRALANEHALENRGLKFWRGQGSSYSPTEHQSYRGSQSTKSTTWAAPIPAGGSTSEEFWARHIKAAQEAAVQSMYEVKVDNRSPEFIVLPGVNQVR